MNCSLPTFRSKNHDRFPRFVDLIKSYLTPMISGLFRKRFSLANLLWRLFFFFLWLKQKVTSPVSIQWFIGSLNNIWLINNTKRQWLQKWIACIFVSVQNCWDKAHFLKISICLSECSGFIIKYTSFGWSTSFNPATPSVMETCLVTLNSLSTINDKYMEQHTAVYPSLHLY